MAFAQSVHNQSSVLKINVMVVDDDPVFLEIMSRMLEKSKYRDSSVMEVTVIAAKDSQEALSTLKVQRNNIDLIITDYYMPGMNGLQLKKKINKEFGNFPIIVISVDANVEQVSLTSGALCFLPKPIKPCDLPKIYESALICKRNGKSTLLIENNQNHNVPQNTQLLPEQAKVMKMKSKIGSCVGTDGSRKNRKRLNVDHVDDDDKSPLEPKKMKITWTDNLHDLFLRAIRHIGLDKAVPKKILEYMNIPYLTRENIASHLQKYRMFLRKVSGQGLPYTSMDSIFSHGHIREPYLNYYTPSTWYDSSLNNRTFYTKLGHGFGQSRLLSTTREPVRFNQMANYSFMNRSTIYEPNRMGSNVTLPMTNSNLNFSSQPSHNEGRTSLFQPSVMEKNTNQTYEPSAINGNDPKFGVMGNFERFTPYQAGPSHFSYEMQSYLNNDNAAYNPEPHTSAGNIQSYNPEPHTNATVQPYNPEPHADSLVQPYNPEQHATIQPHTSSTMQLYNPVPLTNATIYNLEPLTNAAMQPYNPEPHTKAAMQSYNPEPHTNATMQPFNPEPHTNVTVQPYNPEPHTNATMQPFNPEPHINATVRPYIPELHTDTLVQPYNSEQHATTQPHASSTMQPYNPYPLTNATIYNLEPLTNAGMQRYNPEPHTKAAMESYNPEPHTNAIMQPFNHEPHTNATMQPFNPEPHTNATMQSFNPEPLTNATIQPYNTEPLTNVTTQPNLEVPQLENLNIYGELGMINEVSCNKSNFHFENQVQDNLCGQLQQVEEANSNYELSANFAEANTNFELPANLCETQQGEGANTNFEHPSNISTELDDIATELNEILSLDDNAFWTLINTNQSHSNGETSNGLTTQEMYPPVSNINPNQNQEQVVSDFFGENADWTFANTNQGHSNGETSNALTTREMNFPVSNMNPNQNQEQDIPDFIDGSSLNQQELDDEFLNSLINDDVN